MKIKRDYILAILAVYAIELVLAVKLENKDIVLPMILITWVLFVGGAAVINCIWLKKFLKKLESLGTILTVEKNPDKYIDANKQLLDEKISPRLKAIIMSNIAMGYCEKNDFESARKTLISIDTKRLYKKFERIYFLELAYVNFFLEDYEKGLHIVKANEEKINELRNDSTFEPFVNVIYVFKYIAEKDFVKANELLFITEQRFNNIDGEIKYLKLCINNNEKKNISSLVVNFE